MARIEAERLEWESKLAV